MYGTRNLNALNVVLWQEEKFNRTDRQVLEKKVVVSFFFSVHLFFCFWFYLGLERKSCY